MRGEGLTHARVHISQLEISFIWFWFESLFLYDDVVNLNFSPFWFLNLSQ